MKNIFRIARWEFINRIRTRSFLFNTFITPVFFTLILSIPIYLVNYKDNVSVKLIAVIDLTEDRTMYNELSTEINRYMGIENRYSEYEIAQIRVTNSPIYRTMQDEYNYLQFELDSISNLHNTIKDQRENYFKSNSPNRNFSLNKSYEQLIRVREEKELLEIELKRFQTSLDSLYEREGRAIADSMIKANILNAYLVFPGDFIKTGRAEYHSRSTGDLIDSERLENVLQRIILKYRLRSADISQTQVRDFMRSVDLNKFKVNVKGQEEWNIYTQFYGPLMAVFLLFIAIFTTGGYLFSGVLLEKTNRVIEVLMSYATSTQIMGGKILGLGFLGLTQIFIWYILIALFVSSGLVTGSGPAYLNFENGLLFILYFSLGFLFYGAIFITIGSVFASEYDAQQINQFLRTLAIFPVLLSLLVISDPNSMLIRILSYIPFLSPSFMILRIPLSSYPITLDIYISSFIMLISIIIMILLAGRLFRVSTLMQGKKPDFKEIMYWLKKA